MLGSMNGQQMFNACKTTRIFCRPNCPPGRRTKQENRLVFSSSNEAIGMGYRPCLVCLPLDGTPGPWKSKKQRELDNQANLY